jgi:hypothetical protein
MSKWTNRAMYIAPETDWFQTPRPADSAYRAVPVSGTLTAQGGRNSLDTERLTGRTGPSPSVPGRTEGSGSSAIELFGYPAQAVGPVPAADIADLMFRGIFRGTPLERAGVAVVDVTATAVDLGVANAALYAAGDLIAFADSDDNVQWRTIVSNDTGGDYTIDYVLPVGFTAVRANPVRLHIDDDGADTSISFAAMVAFGTDWREMPGTRFSGGNIEFQPNGLARMSLDFTSGAFRIPTVAPSFSVGVNGDPAAVPAPSEVTGCLYVDGVLYETASLTLDLGIQVSDRLSTCRESGRSNIIQTQVTPMIQASSPFADVFQTLQDDHTLVDIRIVSGHSGGSICFFAQNAQLTETAPAESNGEINSSKSFKVVTVGGGRRMLIGRC